MPILKTIASSFLCILLLSSSVSCLYAQPSPSQEYQIKAVFLYHFTQFVEWPDSAHHTESSPIVIGILGEDPFGTYLDEVVAGEEVKGRPIVVQRFHHVDEVDTCHILFINGIKEEQQEQVMQALDGRSILTIGDQNHFIEQGGCIRFMTVNKKIRFQINPDAAKGVGLHISSRLLSLAEIITPEKINN